MARPFRLPSDAGTSLGLSALENLTIELDIDDVVDEERSPPSVADGGNLLPPPRIGPPRSPQQVVVWVDDSIPIGRLPQPAKDILCNQLQLPGYSSMKNWESVVASMGVGQDEMMGASRAGSPLQTLLYRLSASPVNHLLKALVNARRVDTLTSLTPFLISLKNAPPMPPPADNLLSLSMGSVSSDVLPPIRVHKEDGMVEKLLRRGNDFLLVIHYERTKEEKKTWKWFAKNMKEKEKTTGQEVVDLREVIEDGGGIESLERVYRRANQVILCVSRALTEVVQGRDEEGDYQGSAVRTVYTWTGDERHKNGQKNWRCRVVLMGEQLRMDDIPLQWSSTLWYNFPKNWNAFVERTFKEPMRSQSDQSGLDTG